MTEEKKETLTMQRPSKLSLTKTVESGKVKQNFTHGRSKTVTVEVRKTRTFARKDGGGMVEVTRQEEENKPASAVRDEAAPLAPLVRDKAQIQKATREVRAAVDEEAKSVRSEVTEAPQRQQAPAPTQEKLSSAPKFAAPASAAGMMSSEEEERRRGGIKEKEKTAKPGKIRLKGDDNRRSSGKITVSQALEYQEERMRSLASIKRQREKVRRAELGDSTQEKISREVVVPEAITVQELANRMAERSADVVKVLMKMGMMATLNQPIDADTAELVISEFGHKIKRVTEADVENILIEQEDVAEDLMARPPVVTIMGHVDHGKTSLLDALRQTNVVSGEAGGITQHIGAYQIEVNGQKITFLDTPGHEAFTAMRARGAKVTDIVVLVVAADDGIMAQTEEAINHAKAAGVPIIVAINKMDKPEADPARVRQELMRYDLVAEEFGGDIQTVEVSALQKLNLDKLAESILLQSEILELKANPNRKATGTVVEAEIDKGRGVVATFLIQNGTLKVGDIVVAGASWGKVRAMMDDRGGVIEEAIPAQPVAVLGLSDAPMAGDAFSVVESEKTARDITEYRHKLQKTKQHVLSSKSLEQMFADAGKDRVKELPLLVKGDVQGSVEAIIGSVNRFNSDEVTVRVLHSGVGAITESDVTLAGATGAILIGFNVRATPKAREQAQQEKLDIRYYSVIYNLVDDIKDALSGLLSPEKRESLIGYAEIRQVFTITKVGKVAGCMVTDGVIKRGAGVRLLRDNVVIHEGKLKTLKRFKDEVKDVKSGYECGMAFENYDDIREGDVIEAFEVEEVARKVG